MLTGSRITNHESQVTDIRSALSDAILQLEQEHVPSAALASELLLMHTLGRDRAWIYGHQERELGATAREKYFSLIAKRASGVPTQYLTGHQEFWGLDFEVTPAVLIPRPETEHVIEVALERLGICAGGDANRRSTPFRIADVGTGSGCIAIALAHELPGSRIIGTDISPAAIEVARQNVARHGASERIKLVECNLLEGVLHELQNTNHEPRCLDLIASNPPYIGNGEAATLPREVREHEPEVALFAGEIGTEIYAPLIEQAAALLKPDGTLVLELGHVSSRQVLRLLEVLEWSDVTLVKDLAGIARVASARRTAVE